MIGVTLFGLFLTPLFYVVVRALGGGKPLHSAAHHKAPALAPHHLEQKQPEGLV
jgi:multidrug efflux pump